MPWNKRHRIIFTCKFCGEQKPIEEMKVATRFFPPLPVCKDCWKLLEWQEYKKEKGDIMPTAYFFKCRQKREIKDPKQVTLKNSSLAVQGTCPVCGTKIFRAGKL